MSGFQAWWTDHVSAPLCCAGSSASISVMGRQVEDLPWVVADYCTYESSRAAVRVVINDVQTDRYAQP